MDLESTQVKHMCQMDGFICFEGTGIYDPVLSIHQLTFSDTCYISLRSFSFNHSTQFKMYRHAEYLLSINKICVHFLLCAMF